MQALGGMSSDRCQIAREKRRNAAMSDTERKARLAQALRQNLRRRKGQARGEPGGEAAGVGQEVEPPQD